MPIYEYKCQACGVVFEELVLGGKPADIRCPSCESADLEKIASTFSSTMQSAGPACGDGDCGACSAAMPSASGGCGCPGGCGHNH